MIRDIFSDCFAQRENYLTTIDARIKMFFVFATMGISLCSNQRAVPLLVAMASLCALFSIRIPLRIIIFRLLAPLGVTITVVLTQILLFGTTPLFKIHLLGFTLIGYSEGLLRGVLIFSRVIGAVSLIMFLSMTTPLNKLLMAARSFKVPSTWIEIALLTYRYIFVLLEDIVTVRDAQRVRLGYSSTLRSVRSLGELAGSAVIRAYDQSLAIQEAMMLRGYKERIIYSSSQRYDLKDYIAVAIFSAVLLTLLAINLYIL